MRALVLTVTAVLAVALAPSAQAAGSRPHITADGTPDHPRVYSGGGKSADRPRRPWKSAAIT